MLLGLLEECKGNYKTHDKSARVMALPSTFVLACGFAKYPSHQRKVMNQERLLLRSLPGEGGVSGEQGEGESRG